MNFRGLSMIEVEFTPVGYRVVTDDKSFIVDDITINGQTARTQASFEVECQKYEIIDDSIEITC